MMPAIAGGTNMYITRAVTVAAVLAGAVVGFANPAWADDPDGTYTVT
jgi:hypothetical protein